MGANASSEPAAVASAGVDDRDAFELVLGLLRRTHLSTAAELPGIVEEQAAYIGAQDVELYLIDHEQGTLLPAAPSTGGAQDEMSVAGTMAGRAFATTTILRAPGRTPDMERIWLPMLDGTER